MDEMISIHAPRTGSDLGRCRHRRAAGAFQSTLPARGATTSRKAENGHEKISIHAPRTGSDLCLLRQEVLLLHFNPRSPHGERRGRKATMPTKQHFNPRSPHGERRRRYVLLWNRRSISIHAPRTGSDDIDEKCIDYVRRDFNPRSPHGERLSHRHRPRTGLRISIHAPRTGSDAHREIMQSLSKIFQSTLPARGATHTAKTASPSARYFNPRSPHGERLSAIESAIDAAKISIHAPRTGSDSITVTIAVEIHISIHAPRTGSDR